MRIFRSTRGIFVEVETNSSKRLVKIEESAWTALFQSSNPYPLLEHVVDSSPGVRSSDLEPTSMLPPIRGTQEVWAAGVTYFRSRDARMEESESAGGGDFYDRVYDAERPELFFKSLGHKVVGPVSKVRIRQDSEWNVPEPELTLALNAYGEVIGYTIGNDMSSRDIEGENPLYLPQAKVYDGSCALGPCLYIAQEPLPQETEIAIKIEREGEVIFKDSTTVSQIKRSFEELGSYLFRENSYPEGCFLMTGTGIIPPSDFTLQSRDVVSITIEPIGTLKNAVL